MPDYSPAETYTLDSLPDWDYTGTSLAVIGYPIRHSISPQMHNAALEEMQHSHPHLEKWRYFRFEIPPEQLAVALPLFHQKGFKGLNLTVPHKTLAFSAVQSLDENARPIGAVNTLLHSESGYKGFNTDGYGLSQGIRQELGLGMENEPIVLLGAGGAGRAAAFQCLAEGCAELTIVNRSEARLQNLAEALQPQAKLRGIPIKPIVGAPKADDLPRSAIVINSTSLGLKHDDPLPLPSDLLGPDFRLYDMIYNPPETRLMTLVQESGGRACNGLTMLIHQGVKALEIWTEQPVPAQAMERAARRALDLDS